MRACVLACVRGGCRDESSDQHDSLRHAARKPPRFTRPLYRILFAVDVTPYTGHVGPASPCQTWSVPESPRLWLDSSIVPSHGGPTSNPLIIILLASFVSAPTIHTVRSLGPKGIRFRHSRAVGLK